MPAWYEAVEVILQLDEACRDLRWLKERPHYPEIQQPGHWDNEMTCVCFDFFVWAMGQGMAEHVRKDMDSGSWEAVRAAVVDAVENGTALRWDFDVHSSSDVRAEVQRRNLQQRLIIIKMPQSAERPSARVGV